MEIIKNLITRFRRIGVLLLIGLILIIYIAFGFIYLQQGAQQEELKEQNTKLTLVVSRPVPSVEKLQAEYEEINQALAPMTDSAAITMLVGIAEQSGIDISEASGKFRVPTASVRKVNVGGGTYQVLTFSSIRVQGDYESVTAFISDLDSGKTLKTMVLTGVTTSEVEVAFTGEEADRRTEFRTVVSAVINMMDDNALSEIPNPMSFAGGVAANITGDDPATAVTVEGFPDVTTTAAEKGYSGNVTPRDGYVLYGHDKISTDNTTQFETVSYITTLTTKYYYTCEADGTVRQFDGANVATSTEYVGSEAFKIEVVVTVDVDIYIKPG